METRSLGKDEARRQLQLGSRAAGLAVERVVSPWWLYVLSGAVWSATFAFAMGTGHFWVFAVGLLLGAPLLSGVKTRVTGVKISDRLQWKGVDLRAGAWILGAFGHMMVMLMAGNVLEGLYGWDWALWVAGALIGPFWAVAEWRIDLSVRRTLRGWS